MVTLQEIVAERPHLQEVVKLYEKVIEFNGSTSDLVVSLGDVSYRPELIDPLFKSFSSVFDLPEDILNPLKEAMKLGQIDLSRIPINEIPAFSLPYHEDELSIILFLISKPFFLRIRDSYNIRGEFWKGARCPVCKSVPSLSFIKQDEGRILYCSYCESRWKWHRIGCPHCQNRRSDRLEIITTEEQGCRIDICHECRSYAKTFTYTLLGDFTPALLDIISLPLDILAQDRSYKRLSPNPVGMRNMA